MEYGCSFTYAAQGGTNEEWHLSVDVLENGSQVICTVQRRITSYIYFEKFALKVLGPNMQVTEHEVLGTQNGYQNLSPEEFTIQGDTISSVPGKFKNKLEKVAFLSIKNHGEL